MSSLRAGWLEGAGTGLCAESLAWLADEISRTFPPSLAYPAVVPTDDGHVVFEWIHDKARIELEINFDDEQLELYATNLMTDSFMENTFDKGDWTSAFSQVEKLIPR